MADRPRCVQCGIEITPVDVMLARDHKAPVCGECCRLNEREVTQRG
jgi:hypothetical protein